MLQFKLVENANYVVKLCKDTLKLRILGIGGVDIVAQNKTLVLGILWQLLREQTIALLRSLSGGSKDIADADILKWANATMASTGKSLSIASFKASVVVAPVS
jgi:plastin-1